MQTDQRWCTQCGTLLPIDARFCEMCGTPAGVVQTEQAERVIGHLPGEMMGKGLIGWGKKINLVITTERLLCLRETKESRENWDSEFERLIEEEQNSDQPWRALIDSIDWQGPPWAYFYNTPPAELLAAHRDNESIPLSDIVSATVTLYEEDDELEILLANGKKRIFLFNTMGQPAARFLAQALGPERVRLAPLPVA